MKLVYKGTNKEVKVGDVIDYVHHLDPAGTKPTKMVVTSIEKPRHGGSTGRVHVVPKKGGYGQSHFPSIHNMEWIEREDQ